MKIAIVGAGVCGLYLAKNLAQKGNEVFVFEKKKTIGKACCSGLFSARLFDFFPEARRLETNQIGSCIIDFPKRTIRIKFRPRFSVIDHAQLDLLAGALATQAGANIRTGQNIDPAKLEKLFSEYDRVIGADGALSTVRDYVCKDCAGQTHADLHGLRVSDPRKNSSLKFWLGIQGFEQKRDNSDFVETWATKNGFLWKIPRGNDIEWGIMEKPDLAPKLFNEFIQPGFNPCCATGVEPRQIKIENIKSAIIPQGLVIPKNKKITLCGDASGLTKPWSGGGVIWNLTQADQLLKNFPDFIQYRKDATRFFNLRIMAGKAAKFCAYTAGFHFPWIIPQNINLDGDYLLKFNRKI